MDFSGYRCVRSSLKDVRPCDLQAIVLPEYCHGQNCPYFKEVEKRGEGQGYELQDGRRIP